MRAWRESQRVGEIQIRRDENSAIVGRSLMDRRVGFSTKADVANVHCVVTGSEKRPRDGARQALINLEGRNRGKVYEVWARTTSCSASQAP